MKSLESRTFIAQNASNSHAPGNVYPGSFDIALPDLPENGIAFLTIVSVVHAADTTPGAVSTRILNTYTNSGKSAPLTINATNTGGTVSWSSRVAGTFYVTATRLVLIN